VFHDTFTTLNQPGLFLWLIKPEAQQKNQLQGRINWYSAMTQCSIARSTLLDCSRPLQRASVQGLLEFNSSRENDGSLLICFAIGLNF
jgi:hypothetical protein